MKKKIILLTIIPGFRLFNNNVPLYYVSLKCPVSTWSVMRTCILKKVKKVFVPITVFKVGQFNMLRVLFISRKQIPLVSNVVFFSSTFHGR